jgi:hypothetical protein
VYDNTCDDESARPNPADRYRGKLLLVCDNGATEH